MKKVLLSAAIALTSVAVMGQSLVSKKGEPILPQSLDYAVGFDAVPLFNSLKFNDASATIGAASPVSQFTFFGKRFDSENSACRFTVMLSANTSKTEDYRSSTENPDEFTNRNFDLMVGFGHEFRRGNTRVQGYWGVEGLAGIGTSRSEADYADRDGLTDGTYDTDVRQGTEFTLAARGFMGVEYFFAPKMSLGLEYGLTAALSTQGFGEAESFDVAGGTATNNDTRDIGTKSTSFGLNTNLSGGRVVMMFHF
ncbi:outer membrane beta-barrel protein [Luteibaculum oceani]|uniref:Outer membrane beta-barrel protein n=1 Tax=Luteibaculum oceani TaxID=1294296 RepID=A0A5C6VBM0_9FLAO|nr:outer membrane beta-barrel protein [Luteibaculum oceani]TXC82051.1 outer membrane beta-barrel protein [Luteibaculum oceani]